MKKLTEVKRKDLICVENICYNNIATIFMFIFEQNSASIEQNGKFRYFRSTTSSVHKENTTYLSPWLGVDSLGQGKKRASSWILTYPVKQEL